MRHPCFDVCGKCERSDNMYNFLDHKLKPSACASCPETDGFEVENLVAENEFTKSKGFIAYSAIRPPINVDFVLICPIKINYILLWTSTGTQKSTGIELQAKNSNSDFTTICKTQTETPGIVLYNRKHLQKEQQNIPQEFLVQHCKSSHYHLLNSTEKIRIRIFRTLNSVPCIGRIEIWGDISRVCSETTRQTIQKLISGRHNNNFKIETNLPCSSNSNRNEIQIFNIPEEFMDPISCEMMSLPMTLPCGKTIDQSSLEKYQESEAQWGRSPSDPFTGQVFTSLRKPVLNTALKSRIDTFLLKNANNTNTFNIQRTLGRKTVSENSHNNKGFSNQESNEEKMKNETTENQQHSDVSDNLDDVISKSIKQYNITRFTETEIESSKENKNLCGSCKTNINLYSLTCLHFLCRLCLLNLATSRCKICNVLFTKSSVKKYHS